MRNRLTRRMFVGGAIAVSGLAAAGCSGVQPDRAGEANADAAEAPGGDRAAADRKLVAMVVYRDPSCGCCEAWAGIAREAGYQVRLVDHADMPAIKRQYGVPDELASCHTTIVGNYAVEGHVPLEDIERLLLEKPAGVRGIAVPGMPAGSPGMEVPDGTKQAFEVKSFDAAGRISIFRSSSVSLLTNRERNA